jgi:(1->4)-alpha-D-glucan 1-alpha-D-glucosylmutase
MQYVPGATYRLQFNRHFRFRDARKLLPYLHKLGITDIYASPLLAARRGSLHGYDVTDPNRLNEELGSWEEFESLCSELARLGMGLLLDIVPNHMSMSSENRWWMGVLENGPESPFASYFDIEWHHPKPALQNKVLLPILGSPYGKVLENQQLQLRLQEDGFFIHYGGIGLPVALKSYLTILKLRAGAFQNDGRSRDPALRQLQDLIDEIENRHGAEGTHYSTDSGEQVPASSARLPMRSALEPAVHPSPTPSPAPGMLRAPERAAAVGTANGPATPSSVKQKLWRLYQDCPSVGTLVDEQLRVFNGRKGDAASFGPLDQLLDAQAYWLCFWRLADEEINYRRFFTISDLICVRVEDPGVFRATHALILELLRLGKVRGLRVDHVDGLYDPSGYLDELQKQAPRVADGGRTAVGPYLVVEKILTADEALPKNWLVCGTTGYDCLNAINGVFVDGPGAELLGRTYARFTNSKANFKEVAYAGKHLVMRTLFGGEMRSLGYQLARVAEQDRHVRDLPRRELERALVEVTACLPVYRTYTRSAEITARDRGYIERAVAEARVRNQSVSTPVFDFLRSVLLLEDPGYLTEDQRSARLQFVMRWQQFTGPIMAKGVEDTALYIYNRLVSLNEVGNDPGTPGLPVGEFHRRMSARRVRWPHSMNATSTHDTKRGEDVRARINVLSEIPRQWEKRVNLWSRWNRPYVQTIERRAVPDRNEEYLLYQTLLGAWPLANKGVREFRQRLEAYAVKAAREAKVHTQWTRPDAKRENALLRFIRSILSPAARNTFLRDFLQFQREVAFYGAANGLGQILLKLTVPGVPDVYQGTELWDLSLVDPDNRRPVDFIKRAHLLQELEDRGRVPPAVLRKMLDHWEDGRVKLFLEAKVLGFRRRNTALFLEGQHLPLEAWGVGADSICAFARRKGAGWVLVVVPRLLTRLVRAGHFPLGLKVWGETALHLPKKAPKDWWNVLTEEKLEARSSHGVSSLRLADVFHACPVALLAGGSPLKQPDSAETGHPTTNGQIG